MQQGTGKVALRKALAEAGELEHRRRFRLPPPAPIASYTARIRLALELLAVALVFGFVAALLMHTLQR